MIVIARAEVATALKKQFRATPGVAIFADSDSLRALQMIIRRKPPAVVLDPMFAATARGASLIASVRADAQLAAVDFRVLVEENGKVPMLGNPRNAPAADALPSASLPLEKCGTRRAPRFPMTPQTGAMVDDRPSQLVNLSTTGAQIVSDLRLQPAQGIHLALLDEQKRTSVRGVVAWSTLQSAGGSLLYRAGVEFSNQDVAVIEAFCQRYGTTPDRIFVNT